MSVITQGLGGLLLTQGYSFGAVASIVPAYTINLSAAVRGLILFGSTFVATQNRVPIIRASLYIGEDQKFVHTPDTSDDDSGIAAEDWTVEARIAPGRVALASGIVAPIKTVTMTWDGVDARFEGTLQEADSVDLTPGPWTIDLWRTNSGAAKILSRCDAVVYPGVEG